MRASVLLGGGKLRGDGKKTLRRILGSSLAGSDRLLCGGGVGGVVDRKVITLGGQCEGNASAKSATGSGNKNNRSTHGEIIIAGKVSKNIGRKRFL